MSTPAVITIKDGDDSFAIYQHCDGSPAVIVMKLFTAKKYAWPLPRFEAGDFAAAYIRAAKEGGGNIYLSNGRDTDFNFSYIVTRDDDNNLAVSIGRPGVLFSYTYVIPEAGYRIPPLAQIETSLIYNQPIVQMVA
jgi:hypothetical protein